MGLLLLLLRSSLLWKLEEKEEDPFRDSSCPLVVAHLMPGVPIIAFVNCNTSIGMQRSARRYHCKCLKNSKSKRQRVLTFDTTAGTHGLSSSSSSSSTATVDGTCSQRSFSSSLPSKATFPHHRHKKLINLASLPSLPLCLPRSLLPHSGFRCGHIL